MSETKPVKKKRIPLALQPGILVGLESEIRGGARTKSVPLPLTAEECIRLTPMDASVAPVPPPVRPPVVQIDPTWSAQKGQAVMEAWERQIDAFNRDYVEWAKKYFKTRITKRESITIVMDVEEYEQAKKARGRARTLITSITSTTPFGELCLKDKEADLDAAMDESEDVCAAFNAEAKYSRVEVYAIKAFIADDSSEKYAMGIANELQTLIGQMNTAIELRDPKAVESAIRKANAIKSILDAESKDRVNQAVKLARASAKDIAKAIEATGNANMVLLTDHNKAILAELEKSFTVLDLDGPMETDAAVPIVSVGAVDLGGEPEISGTEKISVEELPDETPNEDDVDASGAVDADAAGYAKAADGDTNGEAIDA